MTKKLDTCKYLDWRNAALAVLIPFAVFVGLPRSCAPNSPAPDPARTWANWTHPQQEARKHLNYADALAKSGHVQDAAEQFQLAIHTAPKGSKAWCKAAMGMALLLEAQALEMTGRERDHTRQQANQYFLASVRESQNVRVMVTEYHAGVRSAK